MADDAMPWFLVGLLSGAIGGGVLAAVLTWAFLNQQAPTVFSQGLTVQRDELGRITGIQ